MDPVATLTLNPAIDGACETEKVVPTHKVRTSAEVYHPGGGGINVARVLARLGERVEAVYCAGGATGALLDELLVERGIDRHRVPIADHTRMSLAVYERSSGKEFRFVPEGPLLAESEWQAALAATVATGSPWVVASGSLPRGVPEDFYARLGAALGQTRKLVLDTSGPALTAALAAGGLFLVKPSQGEFEAFVGKKLHGWREIGAAALELVRAGKAAHIAVTLGHNGAVLAHDGGVERLDALDVEVRSATGAGDSFVAGMVHGFLRGADAAGAFRWGMAAGTAAVLSPGTDLCHPPDVRAMWERLGSA
ncbi:MAG: 1-phosphofructokinase family hexose kinase [Sphingomonadales bacterium]|nr:1-phosphofructokinase family hexose kinase [Sphingomonadales bacterium]